MVSAIYGLSMIGNKPKSPLHKALYMTLMEKGARERPCGWLALGVFTVEELSYYEGNQDCHIHRDYNRVMPPIVYTCRVLISDKAVSPPLEGTSTPVKATCDERRPEQELRKS